jgi:Domain of unknown function (DUF4340)
LYLRREGDPRVFSAPAGMRQVFAKSTFELRDKALLSIEEKGLKQIELRTRRTHVTLARMKGQWNLVAPVQEVADPEALSGLISALRSRRALAFLPDEPAFVTKAPPASAEGLFTFEDGARVRLAVGQGTADGFSKPWALREEGAVRIAAEVAPDAISDLAKSHQDFRDKTVISFKQEEVQSIRFVAPGRTQELLVRRAPREAGENQWEMVAPIPGKAFAFKIGAVLWNLSYLKATALGEENPRSWEKYGISQRSKSVMLLGVGDVVLARVDVGKPVPGKQETLYARGARNQVLEVKDTVLNDLPVDVAELLLPDNTLHLPLPSHKPR